MGRSAACVLLGMLMLVLGACQTAPRVDRRDGNRAEVLRLVPHCAAFEQRLMQMPQKHLLRGGVPAARDAGLLRSVTLGDERVAVAVVPNVIVVRGPRSAFVSGDKFLPGILADVGELYVGTEQLSREDLTFLAVRPGTSDDLEQLIAEPPPGTLVGRLIVFPERRRRPAQWKVAVLLPRAIVRLRPALVAGVSESDLPEVIDPLLEPFGMELERFPRVGPSTFAARVHGGGPRQWLRSIARLAGEDELVDGLVEPDLIRPRVTHATDPAPRPQIGDQWHLENTGQFGGTRQADIHAVAGWAQYTTGSPDVVIAIVDLTAGDVGHPALAPAHLAPPEPGDPPTAVEASRWSSALVASAGHGTAVAGLAVARAHAGSTVSGVAPGCRFVGYDAFGLSDFETAAVLQDARSQGCRVINLSWAYSASGPALPTVVRQTLDTLTSDDAETGGVVVVATLSNEYRDNFTGDVDSLVEVPGVMAVGRSTDLDRWGRCGYGAGVSVVAPSGREPGALDGECIGAPSSALGLAQLATIDVRGGAGYNDGGYGGQLRPCSCAQDLSDTEDADYTRCFRGTSAAAPQVAGLAALVLSIDAALTPSQVRGLIEANARRIAVPDAFGGAEAADPNGPARNDATGHGVIDVYRTLKYASAGVVP